MGQPLQAAGSVKLESLDNKRGYENKLTLIP